MNITLTEASNNSSVCGNKMQTLAILPIISKPTRVSASSCSLIDKIVVNTSVNFRYGIFTTGISDQMPIFKTYKHYFDSAKILSKKYYSQKI